MSRTDKTRPWWVQMADGRMTACVPVHRHERGLCTLPDEIDEAAVHPEDDQVCYWGVSSSYAFFRRESHGYREWAFMKHQDRRRDRHDARRAAHDALREHRR